MLKLNICCFLFVFHLINAQLCLEYWLQISLISNRWRSWRHANLTLPLAAMFADIFQCKYSLYWKCEIIKLMMFKHENWTEFFKLIYLIEHCSVNSVNRMVSVLLEQMGMDSLWARSMHWFRYTFTAGLSATYTCIWMDDVQQHLMFLILFVI